jgi:hypothetical protein
MGIFSGIETARIGEGGNYLKPGDYDLEVVKVTVGRTRKGVDFFAVSLKVCGASPDTHQIGEMVDWFNGKDKDAFLPNIKEWARAVLQSTSTETVEDADITEEVMNALSADGGEACAGARLRCKVVAKPIKSKPGQFYSRHYWYPAIAQAA